MACGLTKTVLGVTLTCNNSGTTSHTGLHSATATLLGRTVSWRWAMPPSNQTPTNTDDAVALHKPQVVGQADLT